MVYLILLNLSVHDWEDPWLRGLYKDIRTGGMWHGKTSPMMIRVKENESEPLPFNIPFNVGLPVTKEPSWKLRLHSQHHPMLPLSEYTFNAWALRQHLRPQM